jgi:hypothetical protein
MKQTRADMLARRRQRLIAECRMQRADLACQLQPLASTLESVETGLRIAGRVRQHPEWIAAAGLGLALITPRRLSSFLRGATAGMQTWRAIAPRLAMLLHF